MRQYKGHSTFPQHYIDIVIEEFLNTKRGNGKVVPIAKGWSYMVYSIDDSLIVRIPKFTNYNEKIKIEVDLLRALKGLLPITIPEPEIRMVKKNGIDTMFMIYSQIPGIIPDPCYMNNINYFKIGAYLSSFLNVLHTIPLSIVDNIKLNRVGAINLKNRYKMIFIKLKKYGFPLLNNATVVYLQNLFDKFLSLDLSDFTPVLIHGDIGPGNILFNQNCLHITGIIDWEDCEVGDPAIDLAGVRSYLGNKIFNIVYEKYTGKIDSTFMERIRFYESVIGIYPLLYGIENNHEVYIKKGINQLINQHPK
ncbi:MAG: aminoglycoside phosphotransferase family protein [Candidatus Thermoplasmatota archaeon]|jgi:aminoglycoside 2''-phosphotransferase|nr:aminoglycoside phosphotransferase family protein [Candidatus Thermoplasmatota archaeon]MCL5962949.1 aminoglycoside phosphotransferase family protein [Candidatus Thermoplasmatota archaeon]